MKQYTTTSSNNSFEGFYTAVGESKNIICVFLMYEFSYKAEDTKAAVVTVMTFTSKTENLRQKTWKKGYPTKFNYCRTFKE